MTFEELKNLFADSFTRRLSFRPVSRPLSRPKVDNSYHRLFYPIRALNSFTDVLRGLSIDEAWNDKFSARYLVAEDSKLLLALEGEPGKRIPPHREIRNRSLAAGNIFFSEDHSVITGINHQSGDFHSDIGSMVWAIAVLLYMNAPMPTQFTIMIGGLDAHGYSTTTTSLLLTRAEVLSLLPEGIEAAIVPFNQNAEIEESVYKDPKRRFSQTFTILRKRPHDESSDEDEDEDEDKHNDSAMHPRTVSFLSGYTTPSP